MNKRTNNPAGSTRTKRQSKAQNVLVKLSEYGKQLQEKQKVKEMYGMRENQFKRFFNIAVQSQGSAR